MKRIQIIFATALLLSSSSLSAQTEYSTDYEVQYNVSYSLDSLNLDKKANETVYLYIGSEYGVFLNHDTANAEAIRIEMERQLRGGSINLQGVMKPSVFSRQFYKERQKIQVTAVVKLGKEHFSYQEPAPLTWKITEETKEFLGYVSQKATTSFAGRDYEAWFTLEIPISDGPYVFYGLPGLIVALYDTQNHYSFELQSIEKMEESKTWKLPEVKTQTKTEFLAAAAKQAKVSMATTGFEDIRATGGTVVMKDTEGREMSDADIKRNRREAASRKNNPIELKE